MLLYAKNIIPNLGDPMKHFIIFYFVATITTVPTIRAMQRFQRSQTSGCDTPTTKLVKAAGKGDLKKIRKSIEEGAQVNGIRKVESSGILAALRKSETETTALFKAIDKKKWLAVALLIHKNASIDQTNGKSQTPLHCALYNNRSELVTLLCERGASLDAQDTKKNTPFHMATKKKPMFRPVLAIESKMINQLLHAVLFRPISEQEDDIMQCTSQGLKKLLTARAQKLKEILKLKNKAGLTAYEQLSELRKKQPKARLIDPTAVEPDLQKFLIALRKNAAETVPFNNIFKAAYQMIPKE